MCSNKRRRDIHIKVGYTYKSLWGIELTTPQTLSPISKKHCLPPTHRKKKKKPSPQTQKHEGSHSILFSFELEENTNEQTTSLFLPQAMAASSFSSTFLQLSAPFPVHHQQQHPPSSRKLCIPRASGNFLLLHLLLLVSLSTWISMDSSDKILEKYAFEQWQ